MNAYTIYLMSFAGWILTRRESHQYEVRKKMAIALHDDEDKVLIKSTINALTDPKQNKWAFLGWALVGLSIYIKWSDAGFLSALLMFGISFLLAIMYGLFILPKPNDSKSIADVLKSLYRRKSEFEKEHDLMRADAVDFYIKKVEDKFRLNLNEVVNLSKNNFDEKKTIPSNNEIIGAFGDLMQREDYQMSGIYDVKELGYSKADTLRAFCEEIKNTNDEKMRGVFETGLLLTCHFFEGIGEPLVEDYQSFADLAKLSENINSVEDIPKDYKEKLLEIYKNKKPFDKERHEKYRKQALEDFNVIAKKIGINKIDA